MCDHQSILLDVNMQIFTSPINISRLAVSLSLLKKVQNIHYEPTTSGLSAYAESPGFTA